MRKTIQVRTDDPKNPKFNLIITGKVKKIIDISPSTVSLNGRPGDVLKADVTIRPLEGNTLKLTGIETRFKKGVTAQLIAPEKDGDAWIVSISSRSEKPTDFYEVITVKTDNPRKPKLTIRVFATFLEPRKS